MFHRKLMSSYFLNLLPSFERSMKTAESEHRLREVCDLVILICQNDHSI